MLVIIQFCYCLDVEVVLLLVLGMEQKFFLVCFLSCSGLGYKCIEQGWIVLSVLIIVDEDFNVWVEVVNVFVSYGVEWVWFLLCLVFEFDVVWLVCCSILFVLVEQLEIDFIWLLELVIMVIVDVDVIVRVSGVEIFSCIVCEGVSDFIGVKVRGLL